MKPVLPIDERLPSIIEALRTHSNLVLVAEPGAGKTTRLPVALVQSGILTPETPECVVLQPRRIAARSAAARIAEENGWKLGEEVGYQVRLENRSGPRTRLKVVTEGILTRRLHRDPSLEGVGAVVLDEFHERNLNGDVAVALLRDLQQGLRPELRIVVMSATLEAEPVARFLGDCPIVRVPGRPYPVSVSFRSRDAVWSDLRGIERDVADAVRSLVDGPGDDGGHILVFLPGAGEIRRCETALGPWAGSKGWRVLPLHGSLGLEEQDRVLRPAPDRARKIILATNIAETSLTIEGVSAVVDTGLARVLRCDPRFGLERLEVARISAASAAQRTGRAGRQRAGRSVRLWSEHEDKQLRPSETPEIRRLDLAPTCLALADWGVRDPATFPWFEAPPAPLLASALGVLKLLGAIEENGVILPLGKQLLEWPLHPRLARLMVGACAAARTGKNGERLLYEAATAAALLSEKDILLRAGGFGFAADSDLDVRIAALERAEHTRFGRGLRDEGIDAGAARGAVAVRDALLRDARSFRTDLPVPAGLDSLAGLLLFSFPDRLTRRREKGGTKGLMVGGRGVRLDESSHAREAELFLSLDPQEARIEGKLEARVSVAVPVPLALIERLMPERLSERTEARFDEERGSVSAMRARSFMDLPLAEPVPVPLDAKEAAALIAEAARAQARRLIEADERARELLKRIAFLRNIVPEAGIPDFDDAFLGEVAEGRAMGLSSLRSLRECDWSEALLERLDFKMRKFVTSEAPETLEVPTGNRIRLRYEEDGSVVLSVRLQEVFGWAETPRIAGGRVPVKMELLGPNYRPVQITNDLSSFWNRAYPEVRKELRARYPKHSWPEDPWTAKAVAKGRPRR